MVNEAMDFRNLTLMSVAPTATCDVVEYFKEIYTHPQQENAIVKSKALADLMEAIIGGFFVMGGVEAGAGSLRDMNRRLIIIFMIKLRKLRDLFYSIFSVNYHTFIFDAIPICDNSMQGRSRHWERGQH